MASFADERVYVTNVCLENRWGDKRTKRYALERLLNRLDRTLQSDGRSGALIFDEGDDRQTRKLVSSLQRSNPTPSKIGGWPEGSQHEQPLARLVGEPAFVDSRELELIQLVDFAAFALLTQAQPPSARVVRYRLHFAFEILQPVLNLRANPADPRGVVR